MLSSAPRRCSTAAIVALPLRSRGITNPSYVAALSAQSLTEFDWLAVLGETGYSRGAPSWWRRDADPAEYGFRAISGRSTDPDARRLGRECDRAEEGDR